MRVLAFISTRNRLHWCEILMSVYKKEVRLYPQPIWSLLLSHHNEIIVADMLLKDDKYEMRLLNLITGKSES